MSYRRLIPADVIGPAGAGILEETGGMVVVRPPSNVHVRDLGDATTTPTASLSSYLPTIGMVAAGYHGVRRNNGSLLWGAVWALAGRWFPIAVPTLAVAQGYGQKKVCP